jgi:Ca2+/Na+ antiporter
MYISAIINMADLSTIEGVRAAFGKSIYEISMILVMLISECVLRRKTVFNRKIDTLSMVIMGITVVISLGRAQIIAVIAAIFIMAICNYLLADKKSRAIKSMIGFTTICIFLFVITMYALPQSVSDKFYDKIENSTSEISSTQEFDSFSDIATNWRGYEMSCAKEQWKNYNIFEMMFGGGIQKKTYLKNIPEYYIKTTDFYINQETPLLHNGYYTLLIKGGILAVVGAVIWLISPVYMLYKKKKNNENIDNVIILLGLSVMMILYTYVVRGIVGQTIFVVFGIAVGWLNSDINSKLWKE